MPEWKPFDSLTPADFIEHPLWGFDPDGAAAVPGADERWVRPFPLKRVPRESGDLLSAGELTGAARRGFTVPVGVFVRFRKGEPEFAGGIVLLQPKFLSLRVTSEVIVPADRKRLRNELPELHDTLPFGFRTEVPAGRHRFIVRGKVW